MSWLMSDAMVRGYASLPFSQELVEEYSGVTSSDGAQSAQLSGNPTQLAYLPPDRMTAFSRLSRFGMTFRPLTESLGQDVLTSYLAAFPVKPIPKRRLDAIQRTTYGRRCEGSWQMSLPGTFLPKTSAELQLKRRQTTLSRWVTRPDAYCCLRQTWVLTTFGPDFGYLATPTATANQSAPSMMKHPGCRNFVEVFGEVSPSAYEYLMGWPLGWTDLRLLDTGTCRSVLLRRSDI